MYKKPSSGKRGGNLSQFGLLDVSGLDDGDEPMDMSDDDLDLEAELAAISGEGKKHRPRKPAPVPPSNLDAMIAESLKDVPSDEEVSGDEDDPDLLNELQELALDDNEAPAAPPRTSRPAPPPPALSTDSSTVSLIRDRIQNYTAAERQAKESGESSRARRFGRGLKTLNDLLKQAKAGRPVNDADIPPPVPLKTATPAPSEAPSAPEFPRSAPEIPPSAPEVQPDTEPAAVDPEPTPPPRQAPTVPETQDMSPEKQEGLQTILKRKEEFKAAALACKQAGDKALALEYMKVVKQFDLVAEAFKGGQEMDLSELPTPEQVAAGFKSQQKGEESVQNTAEPTPPPAPAAEEGGLIIASTMEEGLKQRLAAFQQQEAKAKADGNASKARRMGRIVKQYQDAIKLHAAGKPLQVDELPTPLGYGPLPTENVSLYLPTDRSAGRGRRVALPNECMAVRERYPPPASRPPRTIALSRRVRRTTRPPPRGGPPPPAAPSPSPSPSPRPAPRAPPSRYEKQIALLMHRQKEFKDAALKAKKSGNIEQAKEYLRAAKGFDSVIEAARGGLAVDLKSLPLPPNTKTQIEKTFDIVSADDCQPPEVVSPVSLGDDDDDALTKLSQQLTLQLKLCLTNRDHYKEMGNIAEMNRFEHLAVKVKQDLDVVVVAKSLGQTVPKFHYESMQFSVVQCNTDLNENDLELTIVRGIAYNVPNPKEIDTYVKFEFPYPQDAPVSDRTSCIKDTNSPVYNAVFPLAIQRSARPCQRVFKRHGIKFEVCSRGGWFSRDSVLGHVIVKLAPLESQVTLHDAFPIMDGRRPAGGSLEIKLRVRTPLLQQQFENTTHRWLVIDN